MTSTGCIHGRFQVFHNDHLDYLLAAYQRSERLIIGLTSVTGLRGSPGTDHRHAAASNPFTYFERSEMIRAVIEAHPDLDPLRISFSPFPIDHPELLPEFIPRSAICHTTVREDWNTRKVTLLRELGYSVSILPSEPAKLISGTQVRSLIRNGDPSWKKFVPEAVASHLCSTHLLKRLTDR